MGHPVEGGAAPLLKQQQTGACKARPADEENNVAGCASPRRSVFSACPNTVRQRWSLSARERSPPTSGHGSLGRQLGHARAQAVHKGHIRIGRQGQAHREPHRTRPIGGEIAQVDGKGLPADVLPA